MNYYTKLTFEEAKPYIEQAHYVYFPECEFCAKKTDFANLSWYIDETFVIDYTLIVGFCDENCFNCWVLKG